MGRKRADLVDAAKVLRQLEDLLGKGQAPGRLGWPAVIDRGGRWGIYLLGGDLFVLNLSTSVISRITKTEAGEKSPRLSPDGSKLAFVREGDLYVWDLEEGVERRLTSDGSETLLNGTLSWSIGRRSSPGGTSATGGRKTRAPWPTCAPMSRLSPR